MGKLFTTLARVIGPAVSWVWEIGITWVRDTSPTVGLSATMPLNEPGQTSEPLVSVPRAAAARLAAIAAPLPALEPQVLFLDEPTAGVDVELRKGMWEVVRELQQSGVTIILTTHYIEEAELMADRVGVINKGEIVLVEEKTALMHKLGKKQMTLELQQKIDAVPVALANYNLTLAGDGKALTYVYEAQGEHRGVTRLIEELFRHNIRLKDIATTQSSLEDIFVDLVRPNR